MKKLFKALDYVLDCFAITWLYPVFALIFGILNLFRVKNVNTINIALFNGLTQQDRILIGFFPINFPAFFYIIIALDNERTDYLHGYEIILWPIYIWTYRKRIRSRAVQLSKQIMREMEELKKAYETVLRLETRREIKDKVIAAMLSEYSDLHKRIVQKHKDNIFRISFAYQKTN